jgi:site-specific DNA-methyltransferase (adenine-specific)
MLDAEFRFTLDPCTDGTNSMCARWFCDLAQDGLAEDWGQEIVFMNPPYTECEAWMRKAFNSAKAGATVVCLVPVRTDTAWWHDCAMRGEVRLIRGRLRFGSATANAPFPSAVVVFGPGVRAGFKSVNRP